MCLCSFIDCVASAQPRLSGCGLCVSVCEQNTHTAGHLQSSSSLLSLTMLCVSIRDSCVRVAVWFNTPVAYTKHSQTYLASARSPAEFAAVATEDNK